MMVLSSTPVDPCREQKHAKARDVCVWRYTTCPHHKYVAANSRGDCAAVAALLLPSLPAQVPLYGCLPVRCPGWSAPASIWLYQATRVGRDCACYALARPPPVW